MPATPAKVALQGRKLGTKINKAIQRPDGHYHHSELHWCYVAVVHFPAQPNTPTVDVYPDGAQNQGAGQGLIKGVKIPAWYVPTVGDMVLVARGRARMRTTRVVVQKLAGSASPTPWPLCGGTAATGYTWGPNGLYGGPGVPDGSLGIVGDAYWRTDSGGSGPTLYKKTSASGPTAWTAIL